MKKYEYNIIYNDCFDFHLEKNLNDKAEFGWKVIYTQVELNQSFGTVKKVYILMEREVQEV